MLLMFNLKFMVTTSCKPSYGVKTLLRYINRSMIELIPESSMNSFTYTPNNFNDALMLFMVFANFLVSGLK